MNYEEMSDDEINYEVAKHSFDAAWLERHYGKEGMIPDYCNNAEDAWPVIAENRISLKIWGWSEWVAYSDGSSRIKECMNKNPLRAAMIVYLMLKDADND